MIVEYKYEYVWNGRGHLDNSQLIKNGTKATLIVIY